MPLRRAGVCRAALARGGFRVDGARVGMSGPAARGLARSSRGPAPVRRDRPANASGRDFLPPDRRRTAVDDKLRHRHTHAPKGALPNWVLVLGIVGAMVLITAVRSF